VRGASGVMTAQWAASRCRAGPLVGRDRQALRRRVLSALAQYRTLNIGWSNLIRATVGRQLAGRSRDLGPLAATNRGRIRFTPNRYASRRDSGARYGTRVCNVDGARWAVPCGGDSSAHIAAKSRRKENALKLAGQNHR